MKINVLVKINFFVRDLYYPLFRKNIDIIFTRPGNLNPKVSSSFKEKLIFFAVNLYPFYSLYQNGLEFIIICSVSPAVTEFSRKFKSIYLSDILHKAEVVKMSGKFFNSR